MDNSCAYNHLEMRKKTNIIEVILAVSCFLTNISQLPVLVATGRTQLLNTPIWIVVFVVVLLRGKKQISKKTLRIYGVLIATIACLLIQSLVTTNDYFSSSILNCMLLSLFIYTIGEFSGKFLSDDGIKVILASYVISTVVVSISIFVQYFSTGFHLTSRLYVYSSKNSISQIIFTAIVILLFFKSNKSRFINIIRIGAIIFEVLLLMILRSRASIVGFLFSILFVLLGKRFNKRLKYLFSTLIIAVAILMLINESFFNTLVNNILFAGRNLNDLDSLSSGRVSILASFPDRMQNHWITGIGSTYFECFPLSCILQFGVVCGFSLLVLSYSPIFFSLKLNKSHFINAIFSLVCIGYIINSFFEGLAPIGPGVKCYYMWLMFGILVSRKTVRS